MCRWFRHAFLALATCGIAGTAGAVEVTLELSRVSTQICRPNHGPGPWDCDPTVQARVSPGVPRGVGALDFDADGELIHGVLSLEAFSVDGISVPAWSAEIERSGEAELAAAGVVQIVGPTGSGWPLLGVDAVAALVDGNFRSQTDFSGTLLIWRRGYQTTRLLLSFASPSGAGPDVCEGERLYLDDDGDGEVNSRDVSPTGWGGSGFGDATDSDGRMPLEFCASQGPSKKACGRLDFLNDEPLQRRPRDCRWMSHSSASSCEPAEFFYRSQPPVAPTRTCAGHPVVDDADGDGEPDVTDRCASTPLGSVIDGEGCAVAQFCSQQSASSCTRADFGNDEPLAKLPMDCKRTKSAPRACSVATSN